MDYINLLSDSEKTELCKMISGRRFKKLFRKKSNDFSRILRGFRADSLTEEQALSIGISNIDAPFIHTYINQKVEYWIAEVQNGIQNSRTVGSSEETAIIMSLLNSAFHEKPSFYFLFTHSDKSDTYIRFVEAALEVMHSSQTAPQNASGEFVSKKTYTSEKAKWEQEKGSLRKELETLTQDKNELNSELCDVNKRLNTLAKENQSMSEKLTDYQRRSSRVESVPAFITKSGFSYASMCSFYRDYEGHCRLKRIADIQNAEIQDSFCDNYPDYEYLFAKDGPDDEDFIGIWDWKTTPRENDPSRDYILTSYNEVASPIQVVFLSECSSEKELLQNLVTGIENRIHTEKVLFCFRQPVTSRYIGILCVRKELQNSNGKYILKDTVISVPVYEISYSDTLQKQDLTFLRSLDPGMPVKLLPVKDELEYVRNSILEQASWSAFKQRGFQHNDQRMVKDFLSELPVAQLTQEISDKCNCDPAHAEKLLNEFRSRAEEYLDGSDIASDILAEIAQTHDKLFSACTESIRSKWEIQNKEKIAEAHTELNSIHQKVESEKREYAQLHEQYSIIKKDYDEFSSRLSNREKFAQDVENKVTSKIEAAKQNAADFIAEQAFCNAAVSVSVPSQHQEMHWVSGHCLYEDNLEKSSSWKISLEIMEAELDESGIASKYVREFSAFLMACYCNRTVPLLAGPYGRDIADACSSALFGATASVIPDPDNMTETDLNSLFHAKSSVVIIEKPFSSGAFRCIDWLRNHFIIAINPFAEDLLIEPSEFTNYYLPVMTELLVDKTPTRHFLGSIPDSNFIPYISCTPVRLHSNLLNRLKLSTLSRKQIQRTLSDFHNILGTDDVDCDVIFSLLPLSYTLRKMDILLESSLKDSCSKEIQEFLNRYWSESL